MKKVCGTCRFFERPDPEYYNPAGGDYGQCTVALPQSVDYPGNMQVLASDKAKNCVAYKKFRVGGEPQ